MGLKQGPDQGGRGREGGRLNQTTRMSKIRNKERSDAS